MAFYTFRSVKFYCVATVIIIIVNIAQNLLVDVGIFPVRKTQSLENMHCRFFTLSTSLKE